MSIVRLKSESSPRFFRLAIPADLRAEVEAVEERAKASGVELSREDIVAAIKKWAIRASKELDALRVGRTPGDTE